MSKSLDYLVFYRELKRIGKEYGHDLALEYYFAKELDRETAGTVFAHYHPKRRKSDGAAILREFRFDACFPSARLAVEINGGAFRKGGGRHNRGAGYRKDLEKINLAHLLGWTVLSYLPEQILKTALTDVEIFFARRLT